MTSPETLSTLSQIGLAIRFRRSAKWIREQGDYVTSNGETWARMEYSNKRCAGYQILTWAGTMDMTDVSEAELVAAAHAIHIAKHEGDTTRAEKTWRYVSRLRRAQAFAALAAAAHVRVQERDAFVDEAHEVFGIPKGE